MAAHLPPLLSLEIDPRARLLLFDIADDPTYAAMEIQVFDDDLHVRLVTTVARVFRTWPTTYAWTAEVDLGASPASARTRWTRTRWTRTAGPDRATAYGVLGARSREAIIAAALAAVAAGSALVIATVRRRRRR